jgi:hypothetical protein
MAAANPPMVVQFEMQCASRGFHEYRSIWNPRRGQQLQVQADIGSVHDPFSMELCAPLPNAIEPVSVIGHLPREISRFCRYFVNYGGDLEARVTDTQHRRSPIPSGGLEIPILLTVTKGMSGDTVMEKMIAYLQEYYMEPDLIPASENNEDSEDDGDYGPEIDFNHDASESPESPETADPLVIISDDDSEPETSESDDGPTESGQATSSRAPNYSMFSDNEDEE